MREVARARRAGASRISRGFTLVELMITVAIIGVLALLAGVGYARWVRSSKTAEATSMIGAIKAAQESYRAETMSYLSASGAANQGSLDNNYVPPTPPPGEGRYAWGLTTCAAPQCIGFQRLNVQADSSVYYRYSTIAGPADGQIYSFDGRTYPAANDPWFVVKAQGDLDGNGVRSTFGSSSWESYVWSINADE